MYFEIKTINHKFSQNLYDKRILFCVSFLKWNISALICSSLYASIGAEILRFAFTSTEFEKFKSSCTRIISIMWKVSKYGGFSDPFLPVFKLRISTLSTHCAFIKSLGSVKMSLNKILKCLDHFPLQVLIFWNSYFKYSRYIKLVSRNE